jgi:hypothetical protein
MLLLQVDLTNACALISWTVAQYFMVDGSPNSEALSRIFENTAPKLRKMREILREDPGTCVDLDELIAARLELRNAEHFLFGTQR